MRTFFRIGFPEYGKNSLFKDKAEIVLDKNGRVIGATNRDLIDTLIIPRAAEELSLTEIADGAFKDFRTLKSLKIDNGIEEIGKEAFKGCVNLSSVTLGKSVYKLDPSSFENCIKLKSINLPESLEEIGAKAFYNCTKLNKLLIPSSVKTIGAMAFALTHSLEYVVIPEGIDEIAEGLFMDSAIEKIELPHSIKRIGSAAFSRARNLKAIYYKGTLEDFRHISFGLHWNNDLRSDIALYLKDDNGAFYNAFGKKEEKKEKINETDVDKALNMLGLERGATKREVEKAFREKAKRFHPDILSSMNLDPEFTEFASRRFRELQEAEELLLKKMGG